MVDATWMADQPATHGYRAGPIDRLGWAWMLVPLAILATSIAAVFVNYSAAPWMDLWEPLNTYRHVLANGLSFGDLWAQHNEHRIVFPKLIFLADLHWFNGGAVLELVLIFVTQALAALLFLKLAELRTARFWDLAATAAAVGFMFSLGQWENLFWGFQVQFVAVFAAGAWAIHLFSRATEPAHGLRLGLALAALSLLVFATFNMANGVFAGAAMAIAAFVARRGKTAIIAPAVASAILLAIYMADYAQVAYHSPPSLALQHPARYVTYVLAYLGSPWAERPMQAAAVGLVGVLSALAMTWAVFRDQAVSSNRLTLFAVVLFVGVTASATALGRLSFGLEQAISTRYATPAFYFWGAQLVFWSLFTRDALERRPRAALGFVSLVALVLLAPMQRISAIDLAMVHEGMLAGESALIGQVDDPEALMSLYPRPEVLVSMADFARRQGLAPFHRPPPPALDPQRIANGPANCLGALDGARPSTASGFGRAAGWAWDVAAGKPVERLLVSGGGGRILGVGVGGMRRPDVDKALPAVTHARTGWTAAIQMAPGEELAAFAVLQDGRLCEVGRWRSGS